MIVEMINPETNERIEIEASKINVEELKEQFTVNSSEASLKRIIENLDVSPEVKVMLSEFLNYSIKVGTVVLEVGKKIIELLKVFSNAFPNTAAGLVVGVVIGTLLSSIPILGWMLSWLLMPLCTALGLAIGAWKDLESPELSAAIKKVVNTLFAGLKHIPIPV